MGAVVMPPLPPMSSEELQNSRVPSLHGRYPASSLLRTRPPPSRRRTISRDPRLYVRPDSADFRNGTRRASPVARCVWVTVLSLQAPPERAAASARLRRPVLPSRGNRPLGLRGWDLSGPPHVHLRYGPVTRSPSVRWLCR